jgi:hypothetical protein
VEFGGRWRKVYGYLRTYTRSHLTLKANGIEITYLSVSTVTDLRIQVTEWFPTFRRNLFILKGKVDQEEFMLGHPDGRIS